MRDGDRGGSDELSGRFKLVREGLGGEVLYTKLVLSVFGPL